MGKKPNNRIGISLDRQLTDDTKQVDSEYEADVDAINGDYDAKRDAAENEWDETMSPLDEARAAWGFKDPAVEAKEKAEENQRQADEKKAEETAEATREAEAKKQALYDAGIEALNTRERIMGGSN